jgi:hypothetical protein
LGPAWIVDRFWQLNMECDLAGLRAMLAPDCCVFANDELVATGVDAYLERVRAIRTGLRDRKVQIHERVAAGPQVRERWTIEARVAAHPERVVRIEGASWTMCRDGLVAEVHQWWDAVSVARQIAAAPAPPAPRPAAFARPGAD